MAALRASDATLHLPDLNKNLVRLPCFVDEMIAKYNYLW